MDHAGNPESRSPSPEPPAGGSARTGTDGSRAVDRIRQSAREMFYQEGIRAVGVEAIVTRSGVTKPSLYRSFSSKDALAADYLRTAEAEFWTRFDATLAGSDDPRARIRLFFEGLGARTGAPGHRGCALTNAAVEFPETGHPARAVAEAFKTRLRTRLADLVAPLGVAGPEALADAMLLLVEGCYASCQLFPGGEGPARAAAWAADALVEAALRQQRGGVGGPGASN